MFSIVLKCVVTFENSKNPNDLYTTIVKIPGHFVFDELNAKDEGPPKVGTYMAKLV